VAPEGARVLLFDVFGTLVDWRGTIGPQLTTLFRERGAAFDGFAFVDAWRGEYVPSMDRVRNGRRPWANLDTLHAESFDRLLERFGLPDLPAADRRRAVRLWHALDPWPDVPAALERLHERYVLATLSNGNVALLVELARFGKLRFDTIFSAENFGHYKPDPETYRGAASLLGCEPHEAMLVAAHPDDLRAAASNGLRTAFVSRPREYGVPEKEDPALPSEFDIAVRDLGELARRLAGDERSVAT
jgi:2-haloacid dehalogenase